MNTNLFAPLKDTEFVIRSTHPKYTDIIADEYFRICQEPIKGTYENWKKPKNKNKNLFGNIPCWDNSRVVLHQTSDGADYINGNYVSGFDLQSKFIATEQPMVSTLGNFWTMIWEENTRVIVMLNGSEEEAQQSYLYLSPSKTDNLRRLLNQTERDSRGKGLHRNRNHYYSLTHWAIKEGKPP
ncbi:unnamed protein product [Euphydryas editha]|uniref:Tyrosine-protein phosphatase domain-containing protein n=1 Tax=Euphydryas editha TaxID=104508 RepID=A0AAU9UR27_EUPED|nr:unnamed protein product [Euphydryas editha]